MATLDRRRTSTGVLCSCGTAARRLRQAKVESDAMRDRGGERQVAYARAGTAARP